ncbi:hypothetical protein [Coxiella burnetii]|uniref:Uncharacterized protein n=2 Tax=Coxiella burnetii TaxID=777 RepID=Q83B35_COXBU|nr:hypothetical protein [Coxiella burnetii]NP_820665.1 hypothetical protein CBU_1683 [Coxiella burnetii RSA 493]AAO91179.1 hypothetical protein CBU_1683 [Coxiella burnetii RSA 493]ABX77585.1 hypothetical protein COXBURSA331_A1873 [Coxiella burnetii RSA 331]ACI23087.1 hypothetical protein CBUD_0319b [Coxiella burnetii Dugway 5J108-111]ACJ17773.1 hypothetical protein CbuG_0339 [Coxiella burnetii CbuG_Q212]AML48417.1 hypothetical protein AUR58_03915 [Coxiella burnetii]
MSIWGATTSCQSTRGTTDQLGLPKKASDFSLSFCSHRPFLLLK